jgi:hypothetical protein
VRVVLVTRAGCHLCDQALGLLHELGVAPELAAADSDDRLFRLYDWHVPTVPLAASMIELALHPVELFLRVKPIRR